MHFLHNLSVKAICLFISIVSVFSLSACGRETIRYKEFVPSSLVVENVSPKENCLNYDDYSILELGEDVQSKNVVVYDLNKGCIMAMRNAFERTAPASLTKIMTSLVAIEHLQNLDTKITIDSKMFKYIKEQNASVAGFKENEVLTARDLLYGIMLPSGADAAIGIAQYISGSEAEYVKLMNKKAEEIGCFNTNFVNVTGLDTEGHYSTAYDMCLILSYAYKNLTFREIFSSEIYYVDKTNKHENGITLKSTVFEAFKNNSANSNYLIGGKTGFTYAAGLCLATVSQKDGSLYTIVTINKGEKQNYPAVHVFDYQTIINNYL